MSKLPHCLRIRDERFVGVVTSPESHQSKKEDGIAVIPDQASKVIRLFAEAKRHCGEEIVYQGQILRLCRPDPQMNDGVQECFVVGTITGHEPSDTIELASDYPSENKKYRHGYNPTQWLWDVINLDMPTEAYPGGRNHTGDVFPVP